MMFRALLGLAILATAGCIVPSAKYSRTVSQTIETEPLEMVDLTTFNGAVDVVSHDLPFVDMEVTYTGWGSTEEVARENCELMDCRIEANDGVLTINAVKPADQWMGAAAFKLKLPNDCALKIRTSNGNLQAVGLEADVELRTSNGRIDLREIQGAIIARTSNGRLDVKNCSGMIKLKTSNGRVEYAGRLFGEDNEIETSNGRVRLNLPADCVTEVDARTSNGSITCELQKQRILDEGKKHFHALVGQGDAAEPHAVLDVKTSNGLIKISPLGQEQEIGSSQSSGEAEIENAETDDDVILSL